MPTSCKEGLPGDLERLLASFADPAPETLADPYRGASSQYWIVAKGGRVLQIDDQYVP